MLHKSNVHRSYPYGHSRCYTEPVSTETRGTGEFGKVRHAVEKVIKEAQKIKIKIHNIKKVFGKKSGEVVALEGVNLGVKAHRVIMIVGPTSCGKSKLMYMLAEFKKPMSGTMYTLTAVKLKS
jgi:ABC-type glutathione transport system ATPase component